MFLGSNENGNILQCVGHRENGTRRKVYSSESLNEKNS